MTCSTPITWAYFFCRFKGCSFWKCSAFVPEIILETKNKFCIRKRGQCSLSLFQGTCHFFAIMPPAEIQHSSFNVPLAQFIDSPVCQHNPSCRYCSLISGKIKRKGGGYSVHLRGWTNISKNSMKLLCVCESLLSEQSMQEKLQ